MSYASCLRTVGPQPDLPGGTIGTDDHTTDPDCHEKFELCASPAAAGKIVRYVSEAQRWMRQVETACKEERNEGENNSDGGSPDPDSGGEGNSSAGRSGGDR